MTCVHHVEQHVRLAQLFERGAERRHELVWQLPDEPDGVGEDERQAARRLEAARAGEGTGAGVLVARGEPPG